MRFGAFWIGIKMLSYGRVTIHCRITVFARTRWLFSYYSGFRPDARRDMLCFILSASLYVVRLTFRASQGHKNSWTTQLF